jgi:outer membrane protein assembly factor BamA
MARTLSPRTSLILRYSYQRTRIFNITVPLDEVDRQYRSVTLSGPSVSLIDDTRDDALDPHRGHFLGADVQLSLKQLGGASLAKAYLQGANYRRLWPIVTLALNARLGLARTMGQGEPLRLPLPDRFFAGGDYSLRGFQVDTAGPMEPAPSGALVPTGGNALVLAGAELRVDLGRSLSLAVFSDVGNVFPLASDLDLGDLRYTAGLGLRYRTALGPVRLDWGYKLDRQPGESAGRLHFTIGHAF